MVVVGTAVMDTQAVNFLEILLRSMPISEKWGFIAQFSNSHKLSPYN
jgi:hypothetical protein